MANSYITELLEINGNVEKISTINNDYITISKTRYEELQMLYNKNRLLTAQVNELLIQITELQILLSQKITPKTKKNIKAISNVYFK